MAKDLTQGSIAKNVYELAWPMMLGILAIMGFNIVDTYFVAQLGTKELAAMSFTFPVVMTIASIALGIGAALSSMLSRQLGAKQLDEVSSTTVDGLIYALTAVAIITFLGFISMDPLFRLMGAHGTILQHVKAYMRVWYINVLFVVVPMVGNGAIRATGDTKFPALIMLVAGGVNLIFDPLLIFGIGPFPRLELEGAAWATGISRFITLLASVYVLHFREHLLEVPFKNIKKSLEHWKQLSHIAIPAALSNAVIPLSMFIITALVSREGAEVVAGFGVATRIEALITVLISGVAAGIGPFIGQNYGAKHYLRVANALHLSNFFDIAWISLATGMIFLFGNSFVTFFSNDPQVHNVILLYLKIVIPTLWTAGVLLNTTSTLNAIGNSKVSLVLTLLRMVVIYIPFAYIFRHFWGEEGIFYAAALANFVAGFSSYFLFRYKYPRCSLY